MPYRFDQNQCTLISATEYLSQNKRGRSLNLEHLGLTYYGVRDCLCLGEDFQVILPASEGRLDYIFKESCQYLAGEHDLAPLARRCLEKKPDLVEVEEAAPFYLPASDNFWHWMTEGLPKLLALESIGYSGKYIVGDNQIVRESLELMGIGPERLLSGRACYRVKCLMLPQHRLSGFYMVQCMPLVGFVREKLLAACGSLSGGRRLYVRRIGRRKPSNEDEVLELLKEYDFEIMVPEDYSIKEQLRNMTNVDCSVMAHGANATLTLMQKPRSAFVEFFNNRYVNYSNMHAVRLLRLNYRPMVQDLDASTVPFNSMSLFDFVRSGYETDMEVDVMNLRIVLETLLD